MTIAFRDLLRNAARPIWEAILAHPFLSELGAGTLSHERFVYFIRQDYLYLFEFARVLCLGGSKAEDLDTLEMFAKHAANTVAVERAMHTGFMQRLGLQVDDVLHGERTPTTQAYTRHLLTVAHEGTVSEIVAAVLPCYWIYYEVGHHLASHRPADPIYQDWIKAYGSDIFAALVQQQLALVDRLGSTAPEREQQRMTRHFVQSSRYEYLFWDDAYKLVAWPV